jgi:GT2 family glycosyltransferase
MEKQSRNQLCACGSKLKYKQCCGATIFVPGTENGPGASRYGGSGASDTGQFLHILMPTRGSVTIETTVAIAAVGWSTEDFARIGLSRATFLYMPRMGVAEARERLADAAIRGMEATPSAKHYLLWVDDDAAFTPNDIIGLVNELRRNPQLGIISCYYCPKTKGHPGFVPKFPRIPGGHESALMTPGVDFEPHHIIEVPWVGLHCAVMRGELLRKMKSPRFPFDQATGCGEDVGFSHRIRELGYKCAVHAGIMVPHVDAETGEKFVPDIGSTFLNTSMTVPEIGTEGLA